MFENLKIITFLYASRIRRVKLKKNNNSNKKIKKIIRKPSVPMQLFLHP